MTKSSFSLNFGLIKLGGELTEIDRQFAWELFTELATRVAVTGKPNAPTNFDGELYIESLASLYVFFGEARKIMRQFPVGSISPDIDNHLGALIYRSIRDVIRPFLEKWQVDYRFWWDNLSDKSKPPFDRQDFYPRRGQMVDDWVKVRCVMHDFQEVLISNYKLVDVMSSHTEICGK